MQFICNIGQIGENKAFSFSGPGGKEGMLLRIGGEFRAYVNVCSHHGGPTRLEECENGTCVLRCQWHGATFDPATGKALSSPAPEGSGLRELRVILEGENIYYQ